VKFCSSTIFLGILGNSVPVFGPYLHYSVTVVHESRVKMTQLFVPTHIWLILSYVFLGEYWRIITFLGIFGPKHIRFWSPTAYQRGVRRCEYIQNVLIVYSNRLIYHLYEVVCVFEQILTNYYIFRYFWAQKYPFLVPTCIL